MKLVMRMPFNINDYIKASVVRIMRFALAFFVVKKHFEGM
jgi:hypothetical protein